MYTKTGFFIALFFCVTLVGYSEKPPKLPKPKKGVWVEPVKPKNIYGNWTWVETDCCGLRHGLSTPESTSDNILLILNVDNTFLETHTKKHTLPRSGNFILFKDNISDMIQFNDERPAKYSLSSLGDTLTISWKHLELQTERYIRQK